MFTYRKQMYTIIVALLFQKCNNAQLFWQITRTVSSVFVHFHRRKKRPGKQRLPGCLVYSVRSATTGSFLAALREGMKPANTDRKMLIPTSTRAVCQGR